MPHYFERNNTVATHPWKQVICVEDRTVRTVQLRPAPLSGWHAYRVDVSGPEDWPDMDDDGIAAYVRRNWRGAQTATRETFERAERAAQIRQTAE